MMNRNKGNEGTSQVQPVLFYGKKIKLWEMGIFYLILEVNNLLDMMYGSHDKGEPPPAERKAQ